MVAENILFNSLLLTAFESNSVSLSDFVVEYSNSTKYSGKIKPGSCTCHVFCFVSLLCSILIDCDPE